MLDARQFDAVVAQNRARAEQIAVDHHQAAWQDSDRAFQHAHVDVHFKAVYTLPAQKGFCEGDDGRVVAADKFLHAAELTPSHRECRGQEGNGRMDQIAIADKPHVALARLMRDEMAAVDALIRARMVSEHAPRIPEVTAHLVEAGGKRLRPLLTLAVAAMCGYRGDNHIRLAATVEFIHTATLLHDDVVDESEKRRGRPTANLMWDNKSSVLVGDYLFSRAFQLMVETGNLRVLDILANASATIAEGEVLQLTAAQDLGTDEAVYMKVIRGKTAALFAAATEVGGVIASAPEASVTALRDYGDALGIAFQIVDDLLDYGGSTAKLGKNTGDDFRECKLTLPLIKAVAAADDTERAFWQRVIGDGQQKDGDLAQAMALMQRHGTLAATRADAIGWATRAKAALTGLPDSEIREHLTGLADYVVARVV
ncbi:MAG: polyprenyl synthetase family protein [Rhodobacteraceae bacterium]|nr:polyprenyl synthetase family protein [Paracoccaceae bacterium]